MNFRVAAQYLSTFTNYEENLNALSSRNLHLERVNFVLEKIGSPQKGLKAVHIAGSKGKGSTAAFTAHILREAGYKVGLYTSPHLYDLRERLRVLVPGRHPVSGQGGKIFADCISEKKFCQLLAQIRPRLEAARYHPRFGRLTYFEVLTVLAFYYFKKEKVDLVVLETGLGGRLDATNVCDPLVVAITPISLEHTQILGRTIPKIAAEKAAIIKKIQGVAPVAVVALQAPEALAVIKKRCQEVGASAVFIPPTEDHTCKGVDEWSSGRDSAQTPPTSGVWRGTTAVKPWGSIGKDLQTRLISSGVKGQKFQIGKDVFSTALLGPHQVVNAATAVGIVNALDRLGFSIGKKATQKGIATAVWPLRFEIIGQKPWVIVDGAHNPESCAKLTETIRQIFPGEKAILIFGCSDDKDIKGMARQLAPVTQRVVLTSSRHPRAYVWKEGDIKKFFKVKGAQVVKTVSAACKLAVTMAGPDSLIVVTGSIFLAAEARKYFKK